MDKYNIEINARFFNRKGNETHFINDGRYKNSYMLNIKHIADHIDEIHDFFTEEDFLYKGESDNVFKFKNIPNSAIKTDIDTFIERYNENHDVKLLLKEKTNTHFSIYIHINFISACKSKILDDFKDLNQSFNIFNFLVSKSISDFFDLDMYLTSTKIVLFKDQVNVFNVLEYINLRHFCRLKESDARSIFLHNYN